MAADDSREKRRREVEEILELRRSFGTLGRRLVKRKTPIRSGAGANLVELLAQPPKPDRGADARPDEDQQPKPVGDERPASHEGPELDREPGQEAELDQEPEQDQQRRLDQEPALDQELQPEQDQQPESHEEQELAREPELASVQEPQQEQDQQPGANQQAEPVQEPEPALDQDPDQDPELDEVLDQEIDRVSAAVGRVAPVVDERYHGQAPAAAADKAFRIPEPQGTRRRPAWPWLVALVAVFALGMAVDHAVLAPAPRPAAPASTQQAAAAPAAPTASAAPASPRASVPQSCLSTAELGDRLVDLLVKRSRGIEATKVLKEYTQASQTCRKEASSR